MEKFGFSLLPVIFIGAILAFFPHFASANADLRRRCETKREAGACFDVGLAEAKKKDKASRKTAVKFLKLGCTIQTRKAKCSKNETKQVARAYLATKNRVPAAAPKAAIRAPKISPSRTSLQNYQPPPSAPAPMNQVIDYPPAPPPPEPMPLIAPQMQAPPPPTAPQGPETTGVFQGCNPDDPNCAMSSQ